ncbi:uncharacterized protein DFL_004480 [Arthrobotrys flagrans]|uniref:Uncharacterized protein n=1 Tax=Arthrobotrys flagrans TaxID=97331 RepID=A0A437A4R0_ARTFL|nr:hypothetical protein DFL_004480 [Arthrobotrys flagrans]
MAPSLLYPRDHNRNPCYWTCNCNYKDADKPKGGPGTEARTRPKCGSFWVAGFDESRGYGNVNNTGQVGEDGGGGGGNVGSLDVIPEEYELTDTSYDASASSDGGSANSSDTLIPEEGY